MIVCRGIELPVQLSPLKHKEQRLEDALNSNQATLYPVLAAIKVNGFNPSLDKEIMNVEGTKLADMAI